MNYMFNIVLIAIFQVSFVWDNGETINVSKYTSEKIAKAIALFLKDNNFETTIVREWPFSSVQEDVNIEHYMTPGVMVWDLLRSHRSVVGKLQCTFCAEDHKTQSLRHTGLWSNGAGNCRYGPRLIYDSSRIFLLVSAVYVCPENHQVHAHHPSALSCIPSHCTPSYLTNRAGFSVEFLSQITALVDHGTSFHGIKGIVREQYEQVYWRLRLQYEDLKRTGKESSIPFPPFSQEIYPFPHEKIIKNVFASYSTLFLSRFHANMAARVSSWICCDHTFKSAANIGFSQESDGRWVRLFSSIFCVLGDNGDVLHWQFTRGESFNEVSDIFKDWNQRYQSLGRNVEGIVIDNCCKWRGMFSLILPDVPVKLDLFHAVQRFLSALPRNSRVCSGVSKEYGMVFRDPSDLGDVRMKCTPDATSIAKNLDSFEKKWADIKWRGVPVIDENTSKALQNIRLNIEKGCLSGIPPHCSTSGNERLHRELNYILHSNKLDLEMAYIRCSRMFFKHSNKNPAEHLCCPENEYLVGDLMRGFGVEKGVCFVDSKSAVLSLTNEDSNIFNSVQQINADNISKMKAIMSSSLDSRQSLAFDDHGYSSQDQQKNRTAISIALDGLTFYEIFRGLEDIGYARFLSKSNLPNSIGIGIHSYRKLASVRAGAHDLDNEPGHADYADETLEGHLEAFGLEQVAIPGDGNCFFSAIAFHLSLILSSPTTPNSILIHLNSIGITQTMLGTQISDVLRTLLVREWSPRRKP